MTDVTQTTETGSRLLQPLLHDLAPSVAAPALVLAAADGQLVPGGVTGWYVDDVRLLDCLRLRLDGTALELVRSSTASPSRHTFAYVARGLGDDVPDPTVLLERTRTLTEETLTERIEVHSSATVPVRVTLRLEVASDLAPMVTVKQGVRPSWTAPEVVDGMLSFQHAAAGVGSRVVATPTPEVQAKDDGGVELCWSAEVAPGDCTAVALEARAEGSRLFRGGRPAPWKVAVEAGDVRLRRTVEQGLHDLTGLLLREGDDRFLAAGSPWFLTLFGRDSLWAARMLLPLAPSLATSTLRVLARRQGRRVDPNTEEEPGKVLHEVRRVLADGSSGGAMLPPVYFGTVDATPLFVCTLADAHDWGAPASEVAALLPAARRCLEWAMAASAGAGWLRYVDTTGRGLSNQGWKDSHDSVQYADGRLADPPIALCEVQAYAYEAAVRGARLLTAFGEPEVLGLAAWAEDLRHRFTDAFWVDASDGGHLAIALDRDGARVDAVTSNAGHVLGTGILDPERAARLAAVLTEESMDSGFGLRTLTARSRRFGRLSYHGGSVWPHDTAIAVRGLAAEGHPEAAGALLSGVVRAAEGFGYRLPELYGGDAAADVDRPTAYPAACRPQAWSAAAPLAGLVALSGVRVDADARIVTHPERTSTAVGPFTLRGLRVGPSRLDVSVDAEGAVSVAVEEGSGLVVRAGAHPG